MSQPGVGVETVGTIDQRSWDVGGVVGVAVRHGKTADHTAVRHQLGSLPLPLSGRSPAVEIEYAAAPPAGSLELVGAEAATDGEDFYLLADGSARQAVAVDLWNGTPFRLRIPSGTPAIPLLTQVISVAAVRAGHIPLHASAFRWEDRGVLVAGWSKGGKTEALLSFMEAGATYVGDEWLFLSPDDLTVGGIPEPIRIAGDYLSEIPRLGRRAAAGNRTSMRALQGAEAATRGLTSLVGSRRLGKAADLLGRQRHVRPDPERLFGAQHCARRSAIDAVFLMVSTTGGETAVRPADAATVADRIATSTVHEHLRLLQAEQQRSYALGCKGHPRWDEVVEATRSLPARLDGLPAFEVTHPSPASLRTLFEVMLPVISRIGE